MLIPDALSKASPEPAWRTRSTLFETAVADGQGSIACSIRGKRRVIVNRFQTDPRHEPAAMADDAVSPAPTL